MKNLILIKLGGSIITDKSREYFAREKNIARLAGEIKSALKNTNASIIVGHGGGSFPHVPAKTYKTKEGLINCKSLFGMGVTEEAARMLNQIIVKNFISQKIPTYAFSPGSFIISDDRIEDPVRSSNSKNSKNIDIEDHTNSYFDPIKKALEIGIVPVVYGDVVLDRKIGFTIFSTEKILSILAKEFNKTYHLRMIYVTDVDGVLDASGKVIPEITKSNFEKLKTGITGAKGVDVTGGMLHKVEEALILVNKIGVKTTIINGNTKGILKKAIAGGKVKGTLIK